ncbi:extracellular solute-binding protein [Paenibacillus sp. MBLB4367]|uniref:extracellular solute-binding protein n=1 Tax=Paenibacillus sp. MBLB4367 TaxID=3384767 RepID=UPI003907F712
MLRFRTIAGVIAGVSMIAAMAGCKDDNKAKTAVLPNADSMSEHLDISISFWEIGKAFEKNDAVLQKIERDFNVTLKPVQVSYSDYVQKFQVWAASDSFPDVFAHSIASDTPGIYSDWIKQQLIRPLPDDLSKYPNVYQIAQIPDVRALARDKKLYMLPRIAYPTNDLWMLERVVLIRKDWMNQLGLRDPKNFDQFSAMMQAFAEKDPDGNGENDTVGLTANSMNYLSWAFSPTFPQFAASQWVHEEERWVPYYASTKMNDVVSQFRKLYTSGGLDKDFTVMKEGDANEKFAQNKAGAFAFRATPAHLSELEHLWNRYNPGKNFFDSVKILHMWPADDGARYYYVAPTYWTETYFNAKLDDRKMDRIMRLYDYLLSPEGKKLMQYGIEGQDYKEEEEDKIVMIRPTDEKTGQSGSILKKYPSLEVFRSLAAWGQERYFELNDVNKLNLGEANIQKSLEEMRWQLNNARAVPINYPIVSLPSPLKDKLSASINPLDDLIKITISKDDPVAMWQETVKGYNNRGLQDMIVEINQSIKPAEGK